MSGYLQPYEVSQFSRNTFQRVPKCHTSLFQRSGSGPTSPEREPGRCCHHSRAHGEPVGYNTGRPPDFWRDCGELANRFDVVLIFDEVVTGFRYGPGGAQTYSEVIPDLCPLGKDRGWRPLPGAAVAGCGPVMDYLAHRDEDTFWNRNRRVLQQGTYNSNPLSAAAGIVMLERLRDGAAQHEANQKAEQLRQAMAESARQAGIDAWVYGETSWFHVCLGRPRPNIRRPLRQGPSPLRPKSPGEPFSPSHAQPRSRSTGKRGVGLHSPLGAGHRRGQPRLSWEFCGRGSSPPRRCSV